MSDNQLIEKINRRLWCILGYARYHRLLDNKIKSKL